MKGCRSEETSDCYFHPRQTVVGVCPLCLNEKLIFLASKQGFFSSPRSFSLRSAPSSISLSKIFAFTNFLRSLEFRQSKPESSDPDASTSNDDSADSFISIKLEENGVGSWEKNENPNASRNQSSSKEKEDCKETQKSVTEVGKSRAALRWRKRIEELFQVIRSRRSSTANVCHLGNKAGGVKLRKGWIRSQRKSRTKVS